ncbi:hypothetical protein JRO89_XS09G0031700 [Xanthoceras sorbifolium]|uniref:Uncharacterized protein n=1 Tax=Xanthoceras sorbifolium TaxID=99658 RepID=A0ABQ8HKJ8_9ROSI|nr:hypothetical protein JRO89_XS09G0031700 [Xanthoceras sorbifolium]
MLPLEIIGEKMDPESLYEAVSFILSFQFGSEQGPRYLWRYGNWGISFLYGTGFVLGGLAAAGKTYNNCLAIRRTIYTPLEGKRSNLVQTALAVIGLIHAGHAGNYGSFLEELRVTLSRL